MNCPPEIAAALLDLLRYGILKVRSAGWSGDAKRAALEADHIHNLPSLLSDYSVERLEYYWEAERVCYAPHCSGADLKGWQYLWGVLQEAADLSADALSEPASEPTT